MINKLLFVLFVFVASAFSLQAQRKMLAGKVVSGTHVIKGVMVVNLQAQREVKTNDSGMFSIAAKTGDTLVVTDPGIKSVKVAVTGTSFKYQQVIEVVLNATYQLEEVVIEKDNRLTAEGLRIIPKSVARYTPAERKVETGARIGPKTDSVMGGGIVFNGDAIINIFNGRRKALKKALEVERSEQYLEILEGIYDQETLLKDFSIPKEYSKGFLYYAVEDKNLVAAIKAQNPEQVEILISELAVKYLETIKDEK